MTRPRLLTIVVLGMAVAVFSTLGEATSKTIHVTARVVQTTFTGNPASPQLGDHRITTVDLLDQSGIRVGTGGGACTVVSIPPLDTLEQCLLTAAFADGQIIFGGLAHSPEVGGTGRFGILGGTDGFREASGEATLVVPRQRSSTSRLILKLTRRGGMASLGHNEIFVIESVT